MALESFYQDCVIDTPEAVENLNKLCENPQKVKVTGTYRLATLDEIRQMAERIRRERQQ